MFKNVGSQRIVVYAIEAALPKTGDAGNITAYIDKDGGGAVQTNDVNPTELDATNMKGLYAFEMLQEETNADLVTLSAVSSTSNVTLEPVVIYTVTPMRGTDSGALATALVTHDNKLAPVALDSGDATIGGMLTKMADDNDGADFNAEHDSLQNIGDKVATLGAGAITWTYTLTSTVDPFPPIADADVWVTSDIAGTNVIASGTTNASGVVTFYLDAGTVYIWRQKSGWDFTNPDTEVVS